MLPSQLTSSSALHVMACENETTSVRYTHCFVSHTRSTQKCGRKDVGSKALVRRFHYVPHIGGKNKLLTRLEGNRTRTALSMLATSPSKPPTRRSGS